MAVANSEELTRKLKLAPAASQTITFESGNPYRHYIAWVFVGGLSGGNVTVQPKFAGINDGAATVISSPGPYKVKQVTQEEIRPATRGLHKHPDDQGPATVIKSELLITNGAVGTVEVSVYMIAAATPGGA